MTISKAGSQVRARLAAGAALALVAGAATAGTTALVSVSSGGSQANGGSGYGTVSSDGRYVVFVSGASNLVSGDTNNSEDVFLRDRLLGTTVRVSVATGGAQGNRGGYQPAMSADGRYVAFTSWSTDLVSGDTNNTGDVFVRDLLAGTTARVSLGAGGAQSNGASMQPSISNDGRYVAFNSVASNLVTGDTNLRIDTFRRDVVAGATIRVSVTNAGAQANNTTLIEDAPSISADGRYVVFRSNATNLVAGDTNGSPDIFIRDATSRTTARVSLTNAGGQANSWSYVPFVSADGRYVVFESDATNLVTGDTNVARDVFVRDRTGGTTTRASVTNAGAQSNGESRNGSISSDGRYVSFQSVATNLVSGDTNSVADVFVRDRTGATTTRVSVSTAGAQGTEYSVTPRISATGAYVVFEAAAPNLVSGDTNGLTDIFHHTR
jgi:Tol biopolymer transport system component